MTEHPKVDAEQIRARMEREGFNVFARLPAVYAASRMQSRNFLEIAGGLSVVEWRTLDLSRYATLRQSNALTIPCSAVPCRKCARKGM